MTLSALLQFPRTNVALPAYPVANAIVHGDFGIDKVLPAAFRDEDVLKMMKRLHFEVDAEIDSKFPSHRICRAEIYTKDGTCFTSPDCEPRGESAAAHIYL